MTVSRSWRTTTHALAATALAVALFVSSSFAHAGWVNTQSGTNSLLNDIDISGSIALIAGEGGTILRSTDGGASWTAIPTGLSLNFEAVDIVPNSSVAYIVGAAGTVLRSSDSGASWLTTNPPGLGDTVNGIHCASTNICTIIGSTGRIYRTENGGTSWTQQSSGTSSAINDIYMRDANNASAVTSDGTILRTTDGGATWTESNVLNSGRLRSITFNGQDGYAVGNNAGFFKTVNGGATWFAMSSLGDLALGGPTLTDISLVGADRITIVGANGLVYTSTDEGSTWTSEDARTSATFYGVAVTGSPHMIAVGANGTIQIYDTARPTSPGSLGVSGGTPTKNNRPTLTWNPGADQESGILEYLVELDNGVPFSVGNNTSIALGSPLNDGTHSFRVTTVDGAGNQATSDPASFIVDTAGPSVGAPNPASAQTGVATLVSASVTESFGISNCVLLVNNQSAGFMSQGAGKYEIAATFAAAGSYTVAVRCTDLAGNVTTGPATTVSVSASQVSDTTPPTVGSITSFTTVAGTEVSLAATASDNVTLVWCKLFVDNSDKGSMTVSGTTASRLYTFSVSGTYKVKVRCSDGINETTGAESTITVQAVGTQLPNSVPSASNSSVSASPSVVPPNNSSVATITIVVRNTAGSVLANKSVTLTSNRPNNDVVIAVASKTNDLGQATFTVRSTTAGISTLTAVVDGIQIGNTAVNFNTVPDQPTTPTSPYAGQLVKLACPPKADVNHICRAVYFISATGKRHAFPNAKVYFTWYSDFSNVLTVSDTFMAGLPLGKNIAYRPGLKLVKFQSDNTVYAVTKKNVLRRIPSEAIAKALYGSQWNKQIDDISDAFFSDYMFGAEISNANSYSPEAEKNSVATPLSNM